MLLVNDTLPDRPAKDYPDAVARVLLKNPAWRPAQTESPAEPDLTNGDTADTEGK